MSEKKRIELRSNRTEIQGRPAGEWLANNQQVNIHHYKDMVVIQNVYCVDMEVGGRRRQRKKVPCGGTIILKKGGYVFIRIGGYLFSI